MLVAVKLVFPSALNTASLFANILKHLSSHKVTKSESLECIFWILPYIGFTSLVIFSAWINWFKLFVPLIELEIILIYLLFQMDQKYLLYGKGIIVANIENMD